jgi:hypothetical protein
MILLVLVCAQASCLVPQSVEPELSVPHPTPYFLVGIFPAYLLAPVLTLVRQGSADAPPCHCVLDFNPLTVHEDDPTITLEVRWFVDYNPAIPATTGQRSTQLLEGTFDDPLLVDRTLQTFSLDADAAGITTSGVHVVEVVVGETDGFDRASTTQPNRAMKPGYTPAVYRFVVDVRLDPVAGQCPQSPPSRRESCP